MIETVSQYYKQINIVSQFVWAYSPVLPVLIILYFCLLCSILPLYFFIL